MWSVKSVECGEMLSVERGMELDACKLGMESMEHRVGRSCLQSELHLCQKLRLPRASSSDNFSNNITKVSYKEICSATPSFLVFEMLPSVTAWNLELDLSSASEFKNVMFRNRDGENHEEAPHSATHSNTTSPVGGKKLGRAHYEA